MEAEFKNKIRTFEAVFDRKIRTSRLDFRKCSYKINGVYQTNTKIQMHMFLTSRVPIVQFKDQQYFTKCILSPPYLVEGPP